MKKYGKFTYFHCIILLKFASELACFVCICILCGLSAKNPFENHIIGDLSTYFTDVKNITNNILSGPKFKVANKRNLSLGNDMEKKIFLRQLVPKSLCFEYRNYFIEFKGAKLANIFDLNYGKILAISIANLVVTLVFIACCIYLFCCEKKINRYSRTCQRLFAISMLFLYIARFVLSIILFYFIEKGDIEVYDDFLECKNVRSKFFKKFSDIEHLRRTFIAFLIMNIIVQGIDKIEKCFENAEKAQQVEEENSNIF